jgi:hypothetical protein
LSGRQEIRVPGQAEPISHYTDAVRAGDLLFVSGCVSVDGEGRLVGGDQELFGEARPASTLVEVSALAVPGAKLKVEAVALVPWPTPGTPRPPRWSPPRRCPAQARRLHLRLRRRARLDQAQARTRPEQAPRRGASASCHSHSPS